MSEDIVRVKREELEKMVDAITETYNKLDNVTHEFQDLVDQLKRTQDKLEDFSENVDDLIVEEDATEGEEERPFRPKKDDIDV